MAKKLFSDQELEELRRADAEMDRTFVQTQAEREESRRRDRAAQLDAMDARTRRIAENQRAYREANREKYNAYMRQYAKNRKLQSAAAQ